MPSPHRTGALAFVLLSMAACILHGCNRGPTPKPVDESPPAASADNPTTAPPPGAPASPTAAAEPKANAPHPGATPTATATAPGGPAPTTAGGLRWTAQPPLKPRTPVSRMRAAEMVVEGTEGADEVVLTVFHFPGQGGSIQANVDRWLGQIKPADGRSPRDAAKIEERQTGSLQVTRVSVDGTYAASMGPMQAGGAPKPDYRLLGAIAQGPDGPVFFKMVGPRKVVESTEDAFDALIGSLTPVK